MLGLLTAPNSVPAQSMLDVTKLPVFDRNPGFERCPYNRTTDIIQTPWKKIILIKFFFQMFPKTKHLTKDQLILGTQSWFNLLGLLTAPNPVPAQSMLNITISTAFDRKPRFDSVHIKGQGTQFKLPGKNNTNQMCPKTKHFTED